MRLNVSFVKVIVGNNISKLSATKTIKSKPYIKIILLSNKTIIPESHVEVNGESAGIQNAHLLSIKQQRRIQFISVGDNCRANQRKKRSN